MIEWIVSLYKEVYEILTFKIVFKCSMTPRR